MRLRQKQNLTLLIYLTLSILFSGCLTTKKMDIFVSGQYNDQLPKLNKNKTPDIIITSTVSSGATNISNTVQKTSKVLPLIVYWQFNFRRICTLNPAIAINSFSNYINAMANKGLSKKLNGKRLQLSIEQVPAAFAFVDKSHLIWLIYGFHWDKIYIEPDFKDLVVSYQLLENENTVKSGKISIKGNAQNQDLRYFQSWKSAISEYLTDYNAGITNMSKAFVSKLMEEL